jgi:hypothetical protein
MLPGVLVRPDTITFAMFEKENARDFQQVRHSEIEQADLLSGGPFHTCRPAGEDYDGCLSGRITGTMSAEAYNPLRLSIRVSNLGSCSTGGEVVELSCPVRRLLIGRLVSRRDERLHR